MSSARRLGTSSSFRTLLFTSLKSPVYLPGVFANVLKCLVRRVILPLLSKKWQDSFLYKSTECVGCELLGIVAGTLAQADTRLCVLCQKILVHRTQQFIDATLHVDKVLVWLSDICATLCSCVAGVLAHETAEAC